MDACTFVSLVVKVTGENVVAVVAVLTGKAPVEKRMTRTMMMMTTMMVSAMISVDLMFFHLMWRCTLLVLRWKEEA